MTAICRGVKMYSRRDERTKPRMSERVRISKEVMVREAAAVRPIRRGSGGTDKMAWGTPRMRVAEKRHASATCTPSGVGLGRRTSGSALCGGLGTETLGLADKMTRGRISRKAKNVVTEASVRNAR